MTIAMQGKNIVITGGFGALGRAVGTTLASRGAQVALVDLAPAAGSGDMLSLGGVNLGDPLQAAQAMNSLEQRMGGIDGLVNVAGGFAWETVEGGSIHTWDKMYELNLRTAVTSSQAALPHLLARGGGRIVNIGALASLKSAAGMGAYAASKAGVARFTEALAEEFKDRGITVNAVLPSIIDTAANRADMPGAEVDRWVKPEALAAVIAFLLSDDAAPITGACLPVSGRV